MRRPLLVFGVLLAACSPEARFLELPPTEPAQSLVLLVHGDGLERAHIVDLTASPPVLRVPAEGVEGLGLELLLYDLELGRLNLASGEVPLLGPSEGVPLRAPERLFIARTSEGELTEWSEGVPVSVPERGLRVPGVERCVRFAPESISLGTAAPPTFAFSLPSGDVLLGGPSAGLFLFDESGLVHLESPIGEPIAKASLEPSSPPRIWAQSASGGLYTGPATLPLELERVASATISTIDFEAGFTSKAEVEVFALSGDARTFRQLDDQVEALHDFVQVNLLNAGGVARAGEGDAVFVYMTDGRALRYQGGVARLVEVGARPLETLLQVRWDETYVVATSQGRLLRLEGNAWQEIGRGPNQELLAIQPMRDGYFVVGGNGFAAQVVEGEGFCPALAVGGAAAHHVALVAGRHPLVVPGDSEVGASEIRLTLLREP